MIVEQYADTLAHALSEPDHGVYDAMNKGLALASGEVVGFLNADDVYMHQDVLAKVSVIMADPAVDACYADLIYVDREQASRVVRRWKSSDYVPGLFEKGWMPAHPTFFVRKSVYVKFGGFDLRYRLQADFDLALRFIKVHGIQTRYVPEVWVRMRVGGMSNSSIRNIIRGNIESYLACRTNGLSIPPWFILAKVLSRIRQFIHAYPCARMNMRLKLLFIVTQDWYFVSHRLPLAVAAQKAGFDVAVATHVGAAGQRIRDAGIRLIPLSLSRHGGNPLLEVAALVRLYRRERPDIVHHVALKPIVYGSFSAWMAGVPAQVNAVAGLGWVFTSTKGMMRLMRPVVRRALAWLLNAQGSLTIVQNPDDRALLVCTRLPEARLRLIRGAGVDTTLFHPVPRPSGSVCIVLASRMLWDKGVGEFVDAARLLMQAGISARFVLVGDPDPGNLASVSVATLQAWHGHNGVEWWRHREDMHEVFHVAHIACLPSYYSEGLPKVLLEAAACGLPIVTTDAPGCREIVRDNDNGLLVPVRNAEALARALHHLIDNAALCAKMGKRGREIVLAEFSQEQVIAETLEVYRELIS